MRPATEPPNQSTAREEEPLFTRSTVPPCAPSSVATKRTPPKESNQKALTLEGATSEADSTLVSEGESALPKGRTRRTDAGSPGRRPTKRPPRSVATSGKEEPKEQTANNNNNSSTISDDDDDDRGDGGSPSPIRSGKKKKKKKKKKSSGVSVFLLVLVSVASCPSLHDVTVSAALKSGISRSHAPAIRGGHAHALQSLQQSGGACRIVAHHLAFVWRRDMFATAAAGIPRCSASLRRPFSASVILGSL